MTIIAELPLRTGQTVGRLGKHRRCLAQAVTVPCGSGASRRKRAFGRRTTSGLFRSLDRGRRHDSARPTRSATSPGTCAYREDLDGVAGSAALETLKSLKNKRPGNFGYTVAGDSWRQPAASRHIAPGQGCGTCFDSALYATRQCLAHHHGRFTGVMAGLMTEGGAEAVTTGTVP